MAFSYQSFYFPCHGLKAGMSAECIPIYPSKSIRFIGINRHAGFFSHKQVPKIVVVVARLALFGVFWDKMRIDIKRHLGIVGIETPQLQLATAKPRLLHNLTFGGG